LAHEPSDPATLHAWQVPHDALPQHTPSMQLLLEHCFASVQDAPFACFGTHWLVNVQ
jgi:hypothetical protein